MKVLVLGFDGMSPKLIDRWIDSLSTFKAFKEKGILGKTIPPIPAQTPVAWTTFATGKNPGEHGIFSFAMRKKGTYERQIIRPEMVKSKTLWRILSEQGKKVGVINVPMSDAEDVKGFIIPGFMSRSEGVPYPPSLRKRIKQKFKIEKLIGDLETETLEKARNDPDSFFERVNQITDQMTEISLYLLQEENWDFFMAVFMGIDRIHHFFWKNVDKTHPRHEENRYSKNVKDFYIKSDKIVSKILRSIEEDTLVMVVSDHGFCSIHKEVFINNYLAEQGFLKTKNGKIDTEKSKAVSYGYGDIWLNVKGREPKGIIASGEEYEATRSEIIEYLKTITVDGEKPIKDIKKREELWWGIYLNEAPALTTIFNIGYQAARNPEITSKNKLKRYANDNPRWSGGHDGTHDPTDVPGIIGILGPGVSAGKEIQVHLRDLTPAILRIMNVSIPTDMNGKAFQFQE